MLVHPQEFLLGILPCFVGGGGCYMGCWVVCSWGASSGLGFLWVSGYWGAWLRVEKPIDTHRGSRTASGSLNCVRIHGYETLSGLRFCGCYVWKPSQVQVAAVVCSWQSPTLVGGF